MARIRQIKPDFYFDEELAGYCCRDARYFYIGMWKEADREGRLEDRPARLKAQIFPFDDDITAADCAGFIDQLEAGRFVLRYEADGRHLLWVRTLKKHQHFHRDERASKLPEPPKDIEMHRASTVHAPPLHHPCTPDSGYLVSGNGNQVSGSGELVSGVASQPEAPKKRRSGQRTGPPQIIDISDGMRQWGGENCPNLDLKVETEKMLDYHRAKGSSFKDWDAAWRTWMRNAVKFAGNGAGRPQPQRSLDLHERNVEVAQRFVARGSDEEN